MEYGNLDDTDSCLLEESEEKVFWTGPLSKSKETLRNQWKTILRD